MKTLGIFLPTYKRPHKLQEVADNIKATTKNSYTLYFGIEPSDEASIVAARKIRGAKVVINKYDSDHGYVNTIQSIYEQSGEPFFIHANDDFEFLLDWDKVPITMFETPSVMVVGLRQHEDDHHGSAICMIRRKYIEEQSGVVDMPNQVFYPYYHHWCDTEFTEVAKSRGVWALHGNQVIKHHHPGFTNGELDETYKKTSLHDVEDEKTYQDRRHLW